ncbi:hypothetical protein HYH03_007701 [Edaphochlamys debaryana]|uniref:protein-serine/threonine phosphatase n=1 Tax=Edaphochlamys debaryana TaxID=47281 RepID=A0A835XZU0_9CHLO|nr:hypothetical protein HYH03_007701 [Edaphochlamys debaryana]|eukprot:KAG2494057.1 hypothetical protein HYH03_007701 [Edaphochlamys debaryana]
MEDRSSAMTADGVAYLGVFDGHGGTDASIFLQRHLLPTIQAHLQPGCDVHDALTSAFAATNAAFRATGSIQGSTATTVILKAHRLIAANVGDSPAFVVKKSGEVYSVIQEHKIEGEEAARIASQGVPIYRSPTGPAYMGTPDGTRWLNMSRAFGDFVYPAISCEPHVCSLDVSDGKYLVIGSDGLTEKWPVAEAAQYVSQLAAAGWALPAICRCLVERALARGSTDNISCMVVDLEAYMAMHDAETNSGAEGGDAGMAEGEQDAVEAAATPEGGVAGPAATPEVGLGLEGTEAALCEAEAQPQLPAAGVTVDKEAAADSPVPSRPQHGDGSPEQSSSGAEVEAGPSGGQGPNSEAQAPVCEAAPAEALSEGSGAAAKQPTDEVLTSMEELPSA